jgi:exonuclease III
MIIIIRMRKATHLKPISRHNLTHIMNVGYLNTLRQLIKGRSDYIIPNKDEGN